jgi:AcrR family transcriptional regulator
MGQIAAEAGMSVGHIYRYFENKEAIIAAIVEEDLQQARETIARITEDPAGLRAAMLASVDEGVAKMLDRADAALFLEVMAEAGRNANVAKSAARQHEAALECVRTLFPPDQQPAKPFTHDQAVDLLNLIFSGLRVRAIQDPAPDAARLTGAIRAFVAELIGAEASA